MPSLKALLNRGKANSATTLPVANDPTSTATSRILHQNRPQSDVTSDKTSQRSLADADITSPNDGDAVVNATVGGAGPTAGPGAAAGSPVADEKNLEEGEATTVINPAAQSGAGQEHEIHPLSKVRFVLVFIGLAIGVFLFALDQLIVATALGPILAEFNSLTQLSWLANGFFISMLAFNLMYSQWMTIFPSKTVMLFAIFTFEVGSLICGVAPSMSVLILGRAVAGVGASGIFTAAMIILAEICTLEQRAKVGGFLGMAFGLASVLGPLVGGAFSDHVSWRWCFYINLPIGGVAALNLFFLLPHLPPLGRKATYKGYGWHMLGQVARCDWVAVGILLGWSVCLILALEYGGVTKAWNDPSVIAMLVMIPVLLIVLIAWEWWLGDERAMLPLNLLRRRTIAIVSFISPLCWAVFMIVVYYLSEGFQAVYHTSATGAGTHLLPMILIQIVFLIASGRFVAATGIIKPLLMVGPAMMALGSGLLYSISPTTPIGHILGFEVIIAFGVGIFLQNSVLLAQFAVRTEPRLISKATGIATTTGFAGRILGISLAGSIFQNKLVINLAKYVPDLPHQYVEDIRNDATAVWNDVPEMYRPDIIIAYVKTLDVVYVIGVPMAGLAFIAACFLSNERMITKRPKVADVKPADVEQGKVDGIAGDSHELKTKSTSSA